MTTKDRLILRDLAKLVAEAAADPAQKEKARLWSACNALKPERAMVYADPQNGWAELVGDKDLVCEDAFARGLELSLRRTVFRIGHVHDDYPVTDRFGVGVDIHMDVYNGYGLASKTVNSGDKGGAYHIDPSLKTEADFEKLHPVDIQIDYESTAHNLMLVQNVFGDILDVQLQGMGHFRCGLTRILIHWRGLDQLMYDLYDNPELIHKCMAFLRDQQMREMSFFEEKGLLSLNNGPTSGNGTGGLAHNDAMPQEDFNGQVRLKDMTIWGESQEFTSVGPDQFEEFVLQYQLPILNRFGLVDYGCCEPLDTKFDLLIKHLPRLRWVAVSPWCNREIAAEKLGSKYVYVYKPNPSRICSPKPDFDSAERELRETLRIAEGCPVHLVMKDTGTFFNEPERLTKWTEIASRVVREMA